MIVPRTAGPNQLLVISGFGYSKPHSQKGGRVWQIPCFHQVQKMKLNLMTIQIRSLNVNCTNGVAISIDGIAQCKVNSESTQTMNLACQHFLGLKENAVNTVLNETLEGHQRAIISAMTVEEVFRDRVQFAEKVRDCATPDLAKMGMQILSYTISQVKTPNGYLKALGTPSIALVKRDARIGEAIAKQEADVATAEATQQRDIKVHDTRKEIAKMARDRDLVVHANQKEINTAQATANYAKRLKEAEVNQTLKHEQMGIRLVEKRAEARVMEEEVKLTTQRLESKVRLQAETDKYKMEITAAAQKKEVILRNEADAIRIEEIGNAEAEIIIMKAEAEAKAMRMKAQAYEKYGKAALVGEVIQCLPQIAAEIVAPLRNTEKITLISSGDGQIGIQRVVSEVVGIMNTIPDGVCNITGINLKEEIQKVTQ